MNMGPISVMLIITGIILIVAGLLLHFGAGWFPFFGKLPGDIRVEHGNFKFYFPIVTCLLLSLLLTLLLYIFSRLR